jgi:GNAT superfamily N-acetyltransferase
MNSVQISEFSSAHLPELKRIFVESRRHAFHWMDPASFKLHDFEQSTLGESILVATLDSTPVGFIAWWAPENFIHSLFVDPSFIGEGIGKLLLAACLRKINRPATLKCLQANEKAVGFYQSQGWVIQSQGISAEGTYFLLVYSN